MTVVGKNIAAVCDSEDTTINVYDAATGAPRLSLNTSQHITRAEGSSDGPILFCVHQHSREITLWDTQTGGLIHTFTTEFEVGNIAASLTGKYLASWSSDGTLGFWKVESGCGDSRILRQPVVCLCWLDPEDQVALALGRTVAVLEMTTWRTLHTLAIDGDVRGITFSAKRHLLAIWSTFGIESTIVVINTQTGFVVASPPPLTHVSHFTFSGNGDRVVCALATGDLQRFMVTSRSCTWYKYTSRLGTVDSIALLRNGHLVVNAGGSVQLLGAESTLSQWTYPVQGIPHVYRLDNGRSICAHFVIHGRIYLLDMENMYTLASHFVESGELGPSFRPPRRIVVTSKTALYTEHEDEDRHKEQEPRGSLTRAVSTSEVRPYCRMTDWFVYGTRMSPSVVQKLSEKGVMSTHSYELDGNLEWVVDAKSRRVCWLPPGYVSGTENGHCFAGSSIVMAGGDGIVRRLTFREPRSDL